MTKKKKASLKLPQILFAHAGELGQHRGTFITYRIGDMTHQAFYNWATKETKILVTEIEEKINGTNIK